MQRRSERVKNISEMDNNSIFFRIESWNINSWQNGNDLLI